MATVTHAFVSARSDGSDPTQIQPSHWNADHVIDGVRELLTADRTYYVRTDGSDSNTGLANTSGGAWLTLQHAWDWVATNLDIGSYTVTIQLADGTYAALSAVSGPPNGRVDIVGNTTTPANVAITAATTSFGIFCLNFRFLIAQVRIDGVTIRTTDFEFGIGATWSNVYVNRIRWENTGSTGGILFGNSQGAFLEFYGSVTITGTFAAIASMGASSIFYFFPTLVTLVGTPAITFVGFYVEYGSTIQIETTFSGSATGKRYSADTNGIIQTFGAGATYLPGNVAGTTTAGGQYL